MSKFKKLNRLEYYLDTMEYYLDTKWFCSGMSNYYAWRLAKADLGMRTNTLSHLFFHVRYYKEMNDICDRLER